MSLADEANRYIDKEAPWVLAKSEGQEQKLHEVCSDGINLFRALITFLKPVLPEIAEHTSEFLNDDLLLSEVEKPLLGHKINKFKPLFSRIEAADIEKMIAASKEDLKEANKAQKAAKEDKNGEFEPLADEITIDDFAKIDLRVGQIIEACEIPEARKLLKLTVDLGFQKRQVFAGIKAAYKDPKALIGRKVILVANLKPRQMKFGLSEGMVTAAGPGGEQVFLLSVDDGAKIGDRIH